MNPFREIYDALVNENTEQVNNFPWNLSSSDKAELRKANRETRKSLMFGFAPYFDADVISILQEDVRTHVLEDMSAEQVTKFSLDLDSDDALDIVAPLDPELQQEIMRKLSAKIRIAGPEEGLSFPEDSAGRLMQREFVAVPQFWTVGKTIDYLRAARDTLARWFLWLDRDWPIASCGWRNSIKQTGEIPTFGQNWRPDVGRSPL